MRRDTYKVRKITLHPAIRRVMFVLSLKESPLMKRLLPIPALVTGLLALALPAAHANYGFFSNEGSMVLVDRGGPGQISLFLSPVAGDFLGTGMMSSGSILTMSTIEGGPYQVVASPEALAGFELLRSGGTAGNPTASSDDYHLLDAAFNPNAFALYDLSTTLPRVPTTGDGASGGEVPSIVAYTPFEDELRELRVSYSVVLESEFPANEYGILAMNGGAKPLAGPGGLLGGAPGIPGGLTDSDGAHLNAGPEAYAGPTTSSSAPLQDPIVIPGLGGFNPGRVDFSVPEPSSAVLLAISLGALRFIVRKKA